MKPATNLLVLALTALFTIRAGCATDATRAEPLVVLKGSSTIRFADDGTPRQAVVAVRPIASPPESDEEPAVIEISLGDQRLSAPDDKLKAKWRRATDSTNAPKAIELELAETIRRPGIYTVLLAPLPVSNPIERLTVQLDIRLAKLGLPPKLVVARTVIPFLKPCETQTPLIVRETGGDTSVRNLSITRASAFSGTLPIATGVTPASTNIAIPAGGRKQVGYSVDPSTPLGTVNGTLTFSAPELAEPITLEYEVRTKLTSWCVPLVITLGFIVGWLVRKRLVDIAQLGEAREIAKTLLTKVDQSLAELPDKKLQDAVKPLRDTLDNARKQTKTAAIVEATKTLDETWRTALSQFNSRKVAATEKLAELKSLARPPLPLPPSTDQRLEAARKSIAQAAAALALNDVTEAERLLATQDSFPEDIWRTALRWQDGMQSVVQTLRTATVGLPAPIQSQFDERAKTVVLDRIKPQSVFNTPDLRRALFIDFHVEASDARALLTELSTRLGFEWNLIAKAVEPVRSKLQPQYDLLAAAIASFQPDLRQAVDDPALFSATMQNRLDELDTHWRATLLPQITPAEKRPKLEALANERQYLQLANALPGALGTLLEETAAVRTGVAPWLTLPTERLTAAGVEHAPAQRPNTPEPVEPLTPGEARFLQSVLLAVIYIAVYWILNADEFGNSMKDVAMLFITSFGLDLSVEGILKLKK